MDTSDLAAFNALIGARGPSFAAELEGERSRYEPLLNCSGEAMGVFNEILRGGSAWSPTPSIFTGTSEDAYRIFRTAAVLFTIAAHRGITSADMRFHLLGWDQLNLDAKGFCRGVLTARLGSALPLSAVQDLLDAKTIVGLLIPHAIFKEKRRVFEITKEDGIFRVDDD